jgi:hypothetical protein
VGRPYQQQWAEEDALLFEGIAPETIQRGEFVEADDTVLPGDVSLGPLAEKLLASLIPEGVVPDLRLLLEEDGTTDPTPANVNTQSSALKTILSRKPRTSLEIRDMEARLRKELVFLGIVSENDLSSSLNEPDDELSLELKKLQRDLWDQTAVNEKRKSKVKQVAEKWMGYQEYQSLLEEINKNIQQAYTKRYSSKKSKSSSNGGGGSSSGRKIATDYKPIPDGTLHTLKARRKLVREVGYPYFRPELFRVPKESIFGTSSFASNALSRESSAPVIETGDN